MAGLFLLPGLVSYSIWRQQRFNFVNGYERVGVADDGRAYELAGDFEELNRRIGKHLARHLFVHIADDRWSEGRAVEYQSRDGRMQVFLVLRPNRIGQVTVWIHELNKPSKLRELTARWFPPPRCQGGAKTSCIANLKQMMGAKATWALENHQSDSAVPKEAELFGSQAYIRHKPACPLGGTYSLGQVDQDPHCSIPWHRVP